MARDDLRKRLERLNRDPLPPSAKGRPEDTGIGRVDGSGRLDVRLDAMCPGRDVRVGGGSYYAIERRVSQVWAAGRRIFDVIGEAFAAWPEGGRGRARSCGLSDAVRRGLDGLLFVDLETCGFTGTPVFLIGVMYTNGGDFKVEQLFARSYAEERGIVVRFSRLLDQRPHLVTFNGKSFDWPFLCDRAAAGRVSLCDLSGHCDLLHHARRRYRDILPNCRLQTLERYICGRRRSGDIPGSDIPPAYHAFVESGDARAIRDIIHHNFLDLVTLAELLAVLLRD